MENDNHPVTHEDRHPGAEASVAGVQEFGPGVTEPFNLLDLSPISRKRFLALLAASTAFATSGCTNYRDKGEIVPFTKKPEELTPGVANYYASTCEGCPQHCGILIKTREGRPVKLDGNPEHPVNQGHLCAKGQASILDVYDPSRLRAPRFGASSKDLTWKRADEDIRKQLESAVRDGKTILLVGNAVYSPTTANLLADFVAAYPTARVLTYDLFAESNRAKAWELCYGMKPMPVVAWNRARIVLALESDFLGTDGYTVEQTRRFAQTRDVKNLPEFSRLYCIEGSMSLTGTNADYRLRLSPSQQVNFLLALLNELILIRKAIAADPSLSPLIQNISLATFAKEHGLSAEVVRQLVDDLLAHKGRAVVHAGAVLPPPVHVLVNYLNDVLGNTALYETANVEAPKLPLANGDDIAVSIQEMKAGRVGVVIHLETNPAYHFPRSLGYREALKSVPTTVCLTQTENETSELCTYVLPVHHALESWGDFAVRSGIVSLQQPVIAPLFDTRQSEGALLNWMKPSNPYQENGYHQYMMGHWEKVVVPALKLPVDFQSFWYSALHDGVVAFDAPSVVRPAFQKSAFTQLSPAPEQQAMVLMATQSYYTRDGSFAGNGWLQELPDPVTKVVWDNFAAVSTTTAAGLAVTSNDLLEITTSEGNQTFPVFVQPGMADNLVVVALGYGRWNAGPVGTGVGTDAIPLIGARGMAGQRVFGNVTVKKAEGHHELASTQEHHPLDDAFVHDAHRKRKIVREGTVDQFRRDPEFLQHERLELFSISKEVSYPGVKWAMAIDLNKCTGCNACVSSCNVENNIPVVGKEQVAKGREMQWIRIDRYFSGTPDAPIPSHQPMLCQHCDQAPCENVCPVVATTHSPDGLNQMVYNRCVGTKYCSNNCPYKVRRFNFFNFRDHFADGYYQQEPVGLVHNPEVTVRSRGVMEKCTFCVQRIMEARQHAAEHGAEFTGGDVQTACQQACPAQAIVFGNMNDPSSAISECRKHPLAYSVLEELNVRPNVTYVARLRNTQGEGLA